MSDIWDAVMVLEVWDTGMGCCAGLEGVGYSVGEYTGVVVFGVGCSAGIGCVG